MGSKPSHSNDHHFRTDVRDVEPFGGLMTLDVTCELGFMGDGGLVESVVGVVGIKGSGELARGDFVVVNKRA